MSPLFSRRNRQRPFPAASEHGDGETREEDAARPGAERTFEGRVLDRQDEDVEDQGLSFDLGTLVSRRRALGTAGLGAGALLLAACSSSETSTTSSASPSATASASPSATPSEDYAEEMPQETAGPYPGDGSNGEDVLEISGVERSDIRSSIDGGATAAGAAMILRMNIVDMVNDDGPLTGAAVYVWHCDPEGNYSMYADGLTEETYLRGVQVVGEDGTVTFTSIFPGCYAGRWPHIHFEVFPDVASITDAGNAILTSQIALPEEVCSEVYADAAYGNSSVNLADASLESDNVFSDGWDLQLAAVTGDASSGYTVSIDVPIDTSTEPEEASMGGAPGGAGGEPPAGAPGEAPPAQ
ncbi:intradiol ring-cleavage dioxygenase [Rothia halotolerans]|uniref:intradiol ring-cleavage dioxygenase n=1 Tax=Rothia halotolerans TaxID=405770 RepID=UPI00101BC874|nr:intradiol ring-cleavage dioxygenase [Rothia halotolerans]